MSLDVQINVLSVDTSDFYSNEEKRLHWLNHKLRLEKNILLKGYSYKNGRTIVGLNSIEKELHEYGLSDDDLKSVLKDEYDFSCIEDDAIKDVALKYKEYKELISKKNKLAKEAKDELLMLLSNKVEANEEHNGKHHIRELREHDLSDKNVISVFDSYFTRTIGAKQNELCEDFMVVQVFYFDVVKDLIYNGFMYKGEKYVYFTSSAGQIRTKKCVFVKESTWKKHEKSIMCGLTLEDINAKGGNNPNKHLAYLALANSATDVWEELDIDKTIVIEDFETDVFGTYDFIDDVEYSITRQNGKQTISHTDGAGMMLPCMGKNRMVRLPWVKGLLGVFDFKKFIEEHDGATPFIKDIYGKMHNVIEEDIQIIFTKSQFKLWKYYDSWNHYKDMYKKYNCTAGYTNMEEDRIKDATINYQMLQSLTDITDEEIEKIAKSSTDKLKNVTSSIDNIKNIFGITPFNTNKTAFQKSIELYPDLLNDEYAKSHLRSIKDSIVKKCKAGKLDVRGKYTFVLPDLYAACEHWFIGIENPTGLLYDGEIFCWLFRKNRKLDCLRSPHLFLEHAVRENVACNEYSDRQKFVREWFCTDAVYISCHDFISRIVQCDFDGDKLLVVADNTIIEVAERNVEKFDIVPLYYDMKKAESRHLDNKAIYDGLNAAFTGGNIGIYSNNISKIWNSDVFVNGTDEQKKDAIDIIKLLCAENNYVIDFAKTLYKPVRPDDVNDRINAFTNQPLPRFFKYAKDKTEEQISEVNDSFVNKLESIIPNPRINCRKLHLDKIDCSLMMNNPDIEFDVEFMNNGSLSKEGTDPLLLKYCEFNKEYYLSLDSAICSGSDNQTDSYMRSQLKNKRVADEVKEALSHFGYSDVEITDILVKYLYGIKKSANKTALWLCYGDIILENLQKHLKYTTKDIQCVDCGTWFEASTKDNESCRCHECNTEHKRNLARLRKQKQRQKLKELDVTLTNV